MNLDITKKLEEEFVKKLGFSGRVEPTSEQSCNIEITRLTIGMLNICRQKYGIDNPELLIYAGLVLLDLANIDPLTILSNMHKRIELAREVAKKIVLTYHIDLNVRLQEQQNEQNETTQMINKTILEKLEKIITELDNLRKQVARSNIKLDELIVLVRKTVGT